MRKTILILSLCFLFIVIKTQAQNNNVGIGTINPDVSAILHLESTTKGFVAPRMTTAQRLAIASPTNGLMVFDTNVGCYFFYNSISTSWQNLCSSAATTNGINCWDLNGNSVNDPSEDINSDGLFNTLDCQGAVGANGAAGANGANGANGLNCWDLNSNGVNDPSEDVNTDGSFNTLDCQGATGAAGANGIAGTNGVNCWDLNNNGLNDPAEDVNADGSFNTLDCQGSTGAAGANGIAGTNGVNCWDLNNNGVNDPAEDVNADGSFNTLDCQGAAGAAGANGIAGTNGVNCWDLNNNGINDPAEDVNADGSFNTLDCQGATGAAGPTGATGAAGPTGAAGVAGPTGPTGATGATGPTGIISKYHLYGTAGRLAVTSNIATPQPGLTQNFTLTAPATIIVWATIGGRTTGTATGSYANIDMIVYVDGAFLPSGGWNRFAVVNPSNANSFNTCAINTSFTLAAGTHTIDLRTLRSAGNVSVDIGGNATTDVNPGELTIMVLY